MALNEKGGFGFDLEKTFKNVEAVDSVKPTDTHADTHTHTYTHTDTYTHKYTNKEKKTKRLNGWVKQSVWDKVSKYAEEHGTSFNGIIDDLLDEFIEKKGL